MSLDNEVESLRRIPIFANMAPRDLKLLASTSERLCFASGDILFEQGANGDSAYIILGGRAEVTIDTPAGPTVLAVLKENQIVGEVAILCDLPRTATVRAAGELTALRVTKDMFLKLSAEFPDIAVAVMKEIGQRLDRSNSHLAGTMGTQSGA